MWPAVMYLLCLCVSQFLVSVSKENSSTAEVLESISRSVRVKAENLRLAEVRCWKYYAFHTLSEISSNFHIAEMGHIAVSYSRTFFCPQVGKNRFQRMFLPSHSLDTVSSSDMLFCFEVLSKDMAKERVVLLRVQQVIKPLILHFYMIYNMPRFTDIERTFLALCSALQRLQVPNIPISKCAACLKPPVSEEDKLKRCTRCYRVGYCNQWVLLENYTSR